MSEPVLQVLAVLGRLPQDAVTRTALERIVWAWILTIPVSGLTACLLVRLLQAVGIING